jgi:predicted ATPase
VRVRTGEAPSRAFARALHSETEGNPFFIEEIVRHLTEAGVRASAAGASELQRFGLPEGVSQMISRRLDRLDPKTIEWLRVASVIGRDFDVSLLEQLVPLEEEEFLNSLEQALSAGLLLESPDDTGRYSFSHTLIREAL